MNKIYRVIWSKTKNCYVVASELAKRHTKAPQSGVVNKIAALALVGTMSFGFAASAWAADPVDNTYIKIKPTPDATAEDEARIGNRSVGAIAIGEKVFISGSGDEHLAAYSVGIGYGATATGINGLALGKNATMAASHAIGVGAGSLAEGMYSTVMGAYSDVAVNSEATMAAADGKVMQGFGATVLGSLNSSQANLDNTEKKYTSVASSIVGTVNAATDSNGALIFGAGNEITDSYQNVLYAEGTDLAALHEQYQTAVESGDRAEMAKIAAQLRKMVKVSGGQVMAMGGSNTASNAFRSQIMGVGNVLEGSMVKMIDPKNPDQEITSDADSTAFRVYDTQYDLLDGFENKVSHSEHVSVIGTGNKVQNSDGNIIIGDLHGISGGGNNVIIGSNIATDDEIAVLAGFQAKAHTAGISDTVMLGYNTDARVSKSVALGSDSIAKTAAGIKGFDPLTGEPSELTSATWQATAAAVSVGNNTREWYKFDNAALTRIISQNKENLEAIGINTSLPIDKLISTLTESQLATLVGLTDPPTVVNEEKPTDNNYTFVEVAGSGTTRQITNVAAGREDTDAVNVAQLKASQTHYYSVNDNGTELGNYNNDGAIGKYALASGVNAKAQGLLSTVVGANSGATDPLAEKLAKLKTSAKKAVINPNVTASARTLIRMIDSQLDTVSSVGSAGATVIGSMNSIGNNPDNIQEVLSAADNVISILNERKPGGTRLLTAFNTFVSKTQSSTALFTGVTDTVVGSMNETLDDNGSVVYGTGNTIKNSYENFESNITTSQNIAKFTQYIAENNIEGIKQLIKENYITKNGGKGGRSIAIGTNNLIEDARLVRLTGTNNKMKGTGQTNSNAKDFYSYTTLDGYGNEAYYTTYATVLGNRNTIGTEGTITENTIVLGDNNTITAGSNNNIVIGTVTNAVGAEGKGNIVSIGKNTMVTGENSIAIGQGHTVTGENSGAFGDPSTINSANSYSVGNNNTIAEDNDNVFALGNSITTVTSNSVFLGNEAAYVEAGDSTGGLGTVTNATVNGFTFGDFAGATPVGVMSVGAVGKERRIQNVAAGLISTTSTDAINGSQLYAAIDGMQFDIVAGDNVEVIKETSNGRTKYTIHSLNAMVEAGENITVTAETPDTTEETNGKTTDLTAEGDGTTGGSGSAGETGGTTAEPTASDEPITPSDANNHTTTYTIDAKDTRNTVKAGDNITVDEKKNDDGSSTYTISAQAATNVKVIDGENTTVTEGKDGDFTTYAVNVKTDGEVAPGNTGIVTGDTVYKETRVEKDGNYIKKDNTAAENITALDEKVKDNSTRIDNINNEFNNMDNRMKKGLAGAAALAALHPLDFDPDDKWEFSAGVGNYRGETAAAIGAFYHPNDDTIFSLGATVGNGENMVNGGVTFRFGQKNHQSRSKKAMAKEIVELRAEVAELKAMVYSMANGKMPGLDLTRTEEFPDTPENHWAYDYVSVLAGNGVLEGYPDGYFKGERTLTRYEMAAIIYRAMMKGVDVDKRMAEEFAPELARVKVDTLTSHNDGTPSIQRVRVIEGRE